MLRRMDRLVLAEIIGPFFGSLFMFTTLFFAGGELVRFAEYLQQGQGWILVGRLILYSFPFILALTFPMAILLGTLLGFGRLSGDSEITALVAAGASFERIMAPVAVLGLAVSLVGLWFNNSVVPNANREREAIIIAVKNKGSAAFSSQNAINWTQRGENGSYTHVYIDGGVDLATGTMRSVSINVWDKDRMTAVFGAPRADWVVGTKNWTLRDVRATHYGAKGADVITGAMAQTREVTLDTPTQLAILARPVNEITTDSLRERSRFLRAGGNVDDARKADVEIANRFALSFGPLAFALIGAPLGVRPQRAGKGVGFGLSVLITFAYWISLRMVSLLAQGGLIPAGPALMLPNLVCFAVAFYLIRRVLR